MSDAGTQAGGIATFRHLLVPLDGSKLAEAVLPAATELARRFGATLTILHVLEHNPPELIHGERHLEAADEALDYLMQVAKRPAFAGVDVDTHVHLNPQRDVAGSLVEHAVELKCDLIVMATHGSGGIRDVVAGNIAQQVLARGEVPVLLVRPDCVPGGAQFDVARVLVPLDGTADAEKCLPQAAGIARAWQARLLLLRVVPTPRDLSGDQAALAALLPSATRVALEIEETAGVDYLRAKRAELSRVCVQVDLHLRRGDPKVVVPDETIRLGADIVVMATHGRTGLDAFWAGSIGSRVVERLCRPMLIVRSNR